MIRNCRPVLWLILPVLMEAAALAAEPAVEPVVKPDATADAKADLESTAWPHAAAVSPDAYAVLEIPTPRMVLDRLFDPRVVDLVSSHPEFQRRRAEPDFSQAMNLVNYFGQRFQTDFRGLLDKLAGGGLTLAIGPGEQALLIVEAEDAAMLKEVHDFFVLIARNEANKEGQAGHVKSADYRGVTGWSFAPGQAHAILGNRLLLANGPQVLTAAIDRLLEPSKPNAASLPRHQEARKAFAQPPVATLFARMDVLKELPQVKAGLEQEGNPLVMLLLGPFMETFSQADWLAMGLNMDGMTFTLDVAGPVRSGPVRSADAGTSAAFASPDQTGGALANLNVPRQVAGISLYRDLHQFYAAKDELFPQRTSGLIFFENMMGIFFTGRDLTEEVLAELTPEVRLVVTRQEYVPEIGTPEPQLPGFAMVFRMRRPEKFAPIAEEAWQKALGLINFTRGQQAEPGLILDRPTHAEVKYTLAYFSPPSDDARSPADVRFNFQPSLAMPGDYLILSSTDALAKDLIDALRQEAEAGPKPVAGKHSLMELDGKALAALLGANRESMIHQNMVEKGHERSQAEGEIGMLSMIANAIAHLKMTAGDQDAQKLSIELKLDISP